MNTKRHDSGVRGRRIRALEGFLWEPKATSAVINNLAYEGKEVPEEVADMIGY